MPNTYFQFKQFIVHQEHCAMKVSTEACVLGAFVPDEKPTRILDIGTGTGLLALMVAQRIDAPIDAVELDPKAARQASQNVAESPWSERISVTRDDIFSYATKTTARYDLIVSNPPFFTNSLKSETAVKNLAKHDTSAFNKSNLAEVLDRLLSANGKAYILYPEAETRQFAEQLKKTGLYSTPYLKIYNQPKGPVFRIISVVSRKGLGLQSEELFIREGQVHSEKFNALLRPYYLKL